MCNRPFVDWPFPWPTCRSLCTPGWLCIVRCIYCFFFLAFFCWIQLLLVVCYLIFSYQMFLAQAIRHLHPSPDFSLGSSSESLWRSICNPWPSTSTNVNEHGNFCFFTYEDYATVRLCCICSIIGIKIGVMVGSYLKVVFYYYRLNLWILWIRLSEMVFLLFYFILKFLRKGWGFVSNRCKFCCALIDTCRYYFRFY